MPIELVGRGAVRNGHHDTSNSERRFRLVMKPLRTKSRSNTIPIRDAQKALTHARIRDAARGLFFERGFHVTTIDEIAGEAGVQRSTVYLHFKDKPAMLAEIAEEFMPHSIALMEQLPGPVPSHAQIMTWLDGAARLVDRDKVPLSIIREVWVSSSPAATNLDPFKDRMIAALSKNIPAFRHAREDDNLEAYAGASLLLMQMDIACNRVVKGGATTSNKMLLDVVASNLGAFIGLYSKTSRTGQRKSRSRKR